MQRLRSAVPTHCRHTLLAAAICSTPLITHADSDPTAVHSPNGRNSIVLEAADDHDDRARFTVTRDGRKLFGPSPLGPVLDACGSLGDGARVVSVQLGTTSESFQIPWGKTRVVTNRCSFAVVTLVARSKVQWEVELRAYDDGVAFRYQLLRKESLQDFQLSDEVTREFSWALPGKTTFHWWYGEFEDDYKLPFKPGRYFDKHRAYIDFCARNQISYHTVSGDGLAWYKQSTTEYGIPAPDADILTPRPELELPRILAYARERGIGIRLWVHWKPLSERLEDAFACYESWGVKGLMVDFLDRDDQEMIDFTSRMLESAARHHLHIQIHGSSKCSGEQRTFPNLFNREGVLNLEYVKWSDLCTPDHSVNVAYTRALAGPVDFHLGGFRSVSRSEFQPRSRAPVVMGTRCHHVALYVVYENPMPIVADAPTVYEGQMGFDFIREVPTTWDEIRFLAGDPAEYVVVARRKGNAWYVGGITNWTPREIDLPLDFLGPGEFQARLYIDGSLDESQPNEIREQRRAVNAATPLRIAMAPGGGFVACLRPN